MILDVEKNGKKKVRMTKSPAAKDFVAIDFPKGGEVLNPSHYAVRISASRAPVEISIDGSAWKPCRQAAGHFWFDWSKIPSGAHKLAARARTPDGRTIKSKVTSCKVK